MRRPDLRRAFAIAVIAAGLALAGPAGAPIAVDGVAAADAGAGRAVLPLVTRVDARPLRVALQPSFLAVLPGDTSAPATLTFASYEASARLQPAPDRLGGFVRTSRGPPLLG